MKKGFTLAEVLITLGIIGVIAALTVPGLISDTATTQNVTKFKKAHTVLSQALATQMALTSTNPRTATTDADTLAQYFAANMNVSSIDDNVLSTLDGMTFTFTRASACAPARTIVNAVSTVMVGGATGCSVLVDVDGAAGLNAASTGTIADGDDMIKDRFTLRIYDTVVAAATDSLEQELLEGGKPH